MKERRRKWAIFILVLITSLVLLGFFLKQLLTDQLRRFLEAELGRQLDGQVTIHDLNLDMIHPTVQIEGIKLDSKRFGIDDLSIVEARVEVSPFPIFFGTVFISKIEIGDTRLAMHYPPRQPDASASKIKWILPRRHLIRFAVQEMTLPRAEIAVRETSGKWQARLNMAPLQAAAKNPDDIRMSLKARGELWRLGKDGNQKQHLLDHLQGSLHYKNGTLALEELALNTDYLSAVASGEVLPRLDLKLSSQLKLEQLDKAFGESAPASHPKLKLGGTVAFTGVLTGDWDAPKATGKIESVEIVAAKTTISRLRSNLVYQKSELALEELFFAQESGELSGNARWRLDKGQFQGALNVSQIETARIDSVLQSLLPNAPTVFGAFTGSLQGSGIFLLKSGFQDLKLDLALTSPKCGVQGNEWTSEFNNFSLIGRASSGATLKGWNISDFRLDSNELKLGGTGFYQPNRYQMHLQGTMENLWQKLHPSVEKVFGKLEIQADLQGKAGEKSAQLRVNGEKLRIGDIDGWSLKGLVVQDLDQLDLAQLELKRRAARLEVVGGINLKTTDWDQTQLTLEKMPADFVIAFLPVKGPLKELLLNHVDGTLTGKLQVNGAFSQPRGNADLTMTRIRIFDEAVEAVRFATEFSGGLYKLKDVSLELGRAKLQGTGELDSVKSTVLFEAASKNMNSEEFRLLRRFVPKPHPIEVKAKISGALHAPDVEMKLIIKEQEKPYLFANLTGNLQGLHGPKLRTEVSFAGNDSKVVHRMDGASTIAGTFADLDPFAVANFLGHRFSRGLEGNLDGRMEITAEKAHGFFGEIQLQDLRLKQNNVLVWDKSHAKFKVANNELIIDSCQLQGPTTSLSCTPERYLEGYVNLSLLRSFLSFIPRSEGQAQVKIRAAGPITNFDFVGKIQVQNAVITFDGFPTLFENIQADIELDHQKIIVNGFTTNAGNGSGMGRGTMVVGKNWDQINFDLHAEAREIPSRFPNDLPGTATGNIHFTGPGTNALLKANLKVDQLRYTKRFDWRSKLLAFEGSGLSSLSASLLESKNKTHHGVNFDVHCVASEPVIGIKNNIGDILMTGDFRILGKFPKVGLRGNFNVDSGKVTFRNHRFNIDSGTLEFTNPDRLIPYVNVYGSARVQEYNVTLNIHTVSDKVQVDMSSTPPLTETDLVSLLTVGSVSSAYSSLSNQQNTVTEGVAVGIVSGTLQDKVERIGILDSFQVVPDYSQINKASELRLMLGKDLTNELGLIYSTDLYNAGNNQEVRLRQIINNNFAISGNAKNSQQVNENLDLGVDFEFSFDF